MAVPEMPITTLASHDGGSSQDFVSRVVIHDEEFPVSDTSAESVANYFASPAQPYQAHYVVDANSTQHCVPEHRTAAHAPPNQGSIGIEQDGYARFSLAEWQTPGSQGTIKRCAALTREICDRWGIPLVWLTPADLIAGDRGITSHANVSAAFHISTHTDPGPSYPISQFMALVTGAQQEEWFLTNDAAVAAILAAIADLKETMLECNNSRHVDSVAEQGQVGMNYLAGETVKKSLDSLIAKP